jgi:hypothetical protein
VPAGQRAMRTRAHACQPSRPAGSTARPAWAGQGRAGQGRAPCAMPCAAHSEGWRLSASDHAPPHRSPCARSPCEPVFDNTEGDRSPCVVSNMSSSHRCSKLPSATDYGGCFFDYRRWGTHGGPEIFLPVRSFQMILNYIYAGQRLFTNASSFDRLRRYPPVSSAFHGNRGVFAQAPSLCVVCPRTGVRYTRCSMPRAGSHVLRSVHSQLRSVRNPHYGE